MKVTMSRHFVENEIRSTPSLEVANRAVQMIWPFLGMIDDVLTDETELSLQGGAPQDLVALLRILF